MPESPSPDNPDRSIGSEVFIGFTAAAEQR